MDKKYNGFNNGRDRSDGVGGREVNHGTQETMTKDIKELVLNEYKNGNIIVSGIEGLQTMPIKEFIKQDAEFMLYDLNRSEVVVLTFINDPKWVNDYAVCKVIRELKQQLSAERERAAKLIGALNEYIVLLGEELDEVMGFVNAHQWKSTRFEKGKELRQKIKQTLNEYDTPTKES